MTSGDSQEPARAFDASAGLLAYHGRAVALIESSRALRRSQVGLIGETQAKRLSRGLSGSQTPRRERRHSERYQERSMADRISRRLRDKIGNYQKYCAYAGEIVGKSGGAGRNAALHRTLVEALDAIKSLPNVPRRTELVHDVLKKSSAAVDALFELMRSENDRLHSQLQLVGGEAVLRNRETQNLRNEVLQMAANRLPGSGIPAYQGRRSQHGDAVDFFTAHYKQYIQRGQEVIFAPDLKAIDERLLIALRNQCNDALPLGDRSDRTDAIASGRFIDAEDSKRQALVSVSHRSRRAKSQAAYS